MNSKDIIKVEDINEDNFENFCRTCLQKSNLKSIFSADYEKIPIKDLLFQCLSLTVAEYDSLPSKICSFCLEELITFFKFKQKCEKTDKTLRNILTNINCNETIILKECYNYNSIQSDSIKSIDLMRRKKKFIKKQNKQQYNCKICEIDFIDFQSLKSHRSETKHNIIKYPCNICNKFFTKNKLKPHMRIHTKEKPFKCEFCHKTFATSFNLRRHEMSHTGEKRFICDVCGKGFIQEITLIEHKRTHSGESPFVCNDCGRRFSRSARLKSHLKLHLIKDKNKINNKSDECEENKNECQICLKIYSSKSALRLHMLRHGEKSLMCSDCGKKFYTKNNLISHSKVHSNEQTFQCNLCEKSFNYPNVLKTHMLTHFPDKSHFCEICGKSFKIRQHLQYHMRVHSGEKPYKCNLCEKSFSLNGNLNVHMKRHAVKIPCFCEICNESFNNVDDFKTHRETCENVAIN